MRHLLLAAILMLGATWAWAQSYPSQQSDQNQSNTATQSQQTQSSSSATSGTTIEGCLGGSAGSYTLTAKDGTMYQLTGNTDKLAKHVGHEIQVTGTASSASSTSTSGTGSQTGTATNPSANSSQQSFDVTSFKHISGHCSTSGGK